MSGVFREISQFGALQFVISDNFCLDCPKHLDIVCCFGYNIRVILLSEGGAVPSDTVWRYGWFAFFSEGLDESARPVSV